MRPVRRCRYAPPNPCVPPLLYRRKAPSGGNGYGSGGGGAEASAAVDRAGGNTRRRRGRGSRAVTQWINENLVDVRAAPARPWRASAVSPTTWAWLPAAAVLLFGAISS